MAGLLEQRTFENEVEYDYLKSNFFRVIYVSGITGGVNPSGMIQMSLFNERVPIPTKEVYKITEGAIGPQDTTKRQARNGLVREIEMTALMDIGTAIALRAWLDSAIEVSARREQHGKSE